MNSILHEFIDISVHVKNAIHAWCRKDVSALRQYGEGNDWNWKNLGMPFMKLVVEAQNGSKTVPYGCFCFAFTGLYFTPSEKDTPQK